MPNPIVAVVGRPNVGKSTLFNRLTGRRIAIVEDIPGITRDRLYADGEWNGRNYTLIDTGGIGMDDPDPLQTQIRLQAEVAMEEADVILFLADVEDGVMDTDRELADLLRRADTPIFWWSTRRTMPRANATPPSSTNSAWAMSIPFRRCPGGASPTF